MSVTTQLVEPPQEPSPAPDRAAEKKLIDAAEKWLVYRGVPHFLRRREDFEMRALNVAVSVVLATSFGAVAADENGLPRSSQIGLCAGVVLVWFLVDVGRRRLRRESHRFR